MSSIMDNLAHSVREKPSDRNGFAVVVVILALLVMSVVAMAALLTADDDRRSSRAMRESSEAFYAAEAGLYEVLGTLDEGLVADLQPGDSVDLGWRTHDNGARYRAVLQRYDSGVVPKMFGLRVDGRGAGLLGGRRVVSLALESSPARLNLRAEGALVTTGNLAVRDETGVPIIDGNDNILPKRSCGTPVTAVSGVRIRDMALLSVAPGAVILGDLPTQQDPTIGNSTFTELG
ncbi:MAG: PilX N-terminal domain-containing pilus assembly protein, partial [Gemmatimonadales bacterium]